MGKRDLVRRLLEEGDNYEGDLDEDYSQNSLRRMRDPKDKIGGNKPKREKPTWKQIKDED